MPTSTPIGLTPPTLPQATPDFPANPNASPREAGKAFESLFASMMIKQMRQTLTSGQGFFGHDPGDVLGGLFDHFMSQHLAQHGSLGIAAVIEKNLVKRGHGT
jgi:Rod binding domain-containing protein